MELPVAYRPVVAGDRSLVVGTDYTHLVGRAESIVPDIPLHIDWKGFVLLDAD